MKFAHALGRAREPLASGYQSGLGALARSDRGRIRCRRAPGESRVWTGSVGVDAALAAAEPNAPRWDYGIGYMDPLGREHAVWIEVHSGDTKHVEEVLAKLRWLEAYLREAAQELLALSHLPGGRQPFIWIARKGVGIRARSKQERQLYAAGLEPPRRVLELP